MMLLKISPYVQQVCKGAIIILAVVFDMRKNAKRPDPTYTQTGTPKSVLVF